MTENEYKQIVLTGIAARGCLRYNAMCKQAELEKAGLSTGAKYTLGTAAASSILAALIQAARGKSILKGLTVGGLAGAGLGAAYGYGMPYLTGSGSEPAAPKTIPPTAPRKAPAAPKTIPPTAPRKAPAVPKATAPAPKKAPETKKSPTPSNAKPENDKKEWSTGGKALAYTGAAAGTAGATYGADTLQARIRGTDRLTDKSLKWLYEHANDLRKFFKK